jgi:hypothetical protein
VTVKTKKSIKPLAEVTNPYASQLESPYPLLVDTDPVAKRLREVMDILFPPISTLTNDEAAKMTQAADDFAHAATDLLIFIDSREREIRYRMAIDRALKVAEKYTGVDNSSRIELQAKLDMLAKEQLIDYLFLACLACRSPQQALHESIERQRNKIKETRALFARKAKEADSGKIDALVRHHAHRRWKENPKRRNNAAGTASDIRAKVNEDLVSSGLKQIGLEAIRKRIQAFK